VDSVGFFERRQIKDVRAYLQLLVNPKDDEACRRVINTPRRGIGARTLEKLQEAARAGESLMEVVRRADGLESLDSRAAAAVAGFWGLYRELQALDDDPVAGLVQKLLEATEYVKREPGEQRADTQELMDLLLGYARQYDEQEEGGRLRGFLERTSLVSDVDGWNADAEAVPFMTLHSAKGLEFDAVFIVGAEDGMLPHRRAVEDHVHASEDAALEEERRLFYVGMTRARHRLFITYARTRTLRGRKEASGPSQFLRELPEEGVRRPAEPVAAGAFAEEMQYVLRKKRPSLQILDGDGERLAQGTRVRHPIYGEGEILESAPVGRRHMVRVRFFDHGTMALILGAGDVATA
jgi:DNA helicase-2/ATP-dependent DNA helicase PcrA